MTDRYQSLMHTPVGRLLARNLGLPTPVRLDRWTDGDPLVSGSVGLGGDGRLGPVLAHTLRELGVAVDAAPTSERAYRGLVFDATAVTSSDRLVTLQEFFAPLLRSLSACSRVLVLGTPPESASSGRERVAQRALEGFTRSLGKEVGRGGTVQLVYVEPAADRALASTLGFLLSTRSAYVSGQVVRIGSHGWTEASSVGTPEDPLRPLAGRVAVVTGAARGIGEQIVRVLHRDGARVVGVDLPRVAGDLVSLAREVDGDHLALDITAVDAPQRIARHLREGHGGVDVVVHNAGVTRDRRLRNMTRDAFASAVAVNLTAPETITATLLETGVLRPHGRVVGVASVAGIAGNVGQTNYAASKAGVIGLVDSLAGQLGDQITVNAVAPGFIETAMTAAVPVATREAGRRLNALSQAGLPVDVAETVAWFAHPGSAAVSGNVVRVCGQMMLGA